MASVAATAHKVPSGIYPGESGVTVLCSSPTGFTCAGAGYNGTSSQIRGNGWATWQYWKYGSGPASGPKHNCTTYAAYRLQQNGYAYPGWTGNASQWATKAQRNHVTVNQTPAVGSIAQWNGNHVAYVEAVTATYIITTSDSLGNDRKGHPLGTDRLEIARNSPYMPDNFIHFKDLKATLPAQPGGLSTTSPTTSSLVLHWSESAIDQTGFVTQYRIANGAWHAGPSVGPNVRSVTVGGLQPGKRYTFQVGARNSAGTHWSAYFYGSTQEQSTPPPVSKPPAPAPAPAPYHAGRQVKVASQATGGDSGHTGPNNTYPAGPLRSANSAIWIVCYVNGQQIKGPYDTTPMWDLSDDGLYYSDAWLYTGTNGAAVPPCHLKTVTIASQATGGVSGHQGPGNQYKAGPNHAKSTPITIACYVTGQSITGPYDTTNMWDLAVGGYYYTDAWLYTGTNGPAVPHC